MQFVIVILNLCLSYLKVICKELFTFFVLEGINALTDGLLEAFWGIIYPL